MTARIPRPLDPKIVCYALRLATKICEFYESGDRHADASLTVLYVVFEDNQYLMGCLYAVRLAYVNRLNEN